MNEEQQIRLTIDQAKASVARGEAMKRLMVNPDFKSIITDGYLTNEAVRLTHLMGDINWQSDEKQQLIISQMKAISALEEHFRSVLQHAQTSDNALRENEAELRRSYQEKQEAIQNGEEPELESEEV